MIDEVTSGSLAKNGKLNEVIRYLNSIINTHVEISDIGDGSPDAPGFHITENQSLLVIPEGGLPEGYVETSVTLCQNGSPVDGSILFKIDEE